MDSSQDVDQVNKRSAAPWMAVVARARVQRATVRSSTLRPRRPPEGLGARCDRASSADQPGLASRAESSYADRIADDVASADASGVAGTPSFFINGKRYEGAYDFATLTDAVRAARTRAVAARLREPARPGLRGG